MGHWKDLAFTLSERGGLCRVLSLRVMCSDFCFRSISLASVLRIDYGWAREKAERPLKSYGDNPSEK